MKATLKGRFEADKTSAVATLAAPVGDLRFKVSTTEATIAKGPSLNGLALTLEKPGSFAIDYNVPKKEFKFMYMNSFRVREKQMNLTYTHALGDNRTAVDGAVVFDPANKVSGSYTFGSGNCKVKYAYAHGNERRTLIEPSYDFSKYAWDFGVTRKLESGDSLRAVYQSSSKALGVEWNRDSKVTGSFKITATFNLLVLNLVPKLMAETTWNIEI